MSELPLFTLLFATGLMLFALSLFATAMKSTSPPGDRHRRGRRLLGATLLEGVGMGLFWWGLIDAELNPLLFLNVSALLLLLVVALVTLALLDWSAVARAERHRKLSLLTQELYGFPLREMTDAEAERVGRGALETFLRERRDRSTSIGRGESGAAGPGATS